LQRLLRGTALSTVATDFKAAYYDVEAAFTLNLPFQTVKQIAFKFRDFPAAQASHVNVVTVRPAFVEVFFALHVHEVKLVDQAMPFQQLERAIDRDAIDTRIELARMAQNLGSIQMLLGGFNHAKDRPPLVREP
jgi:hypothetical protein